MCCSIIMKLKEKFKAIALRESGKSYSDILKTINVSKGTLSLWLRDIELTSEQKIKLIEGQDIGRMKASKNRQKARIEKTQSIAFEAKNEVKELMRNPLFLSGLMLYWAEGDKSELHEHVKFTNADPKMIALMMQWFRRFCKIPEERFRACIHIHSLHVKKNIENYWSHITGIPFSQFYRTQIKKTSLRQRRNKIYEGTCAISTNNRSLFRRIQGWKMGFLEKINQ